MRGGRLPEEPPSPLVVLPLPGRHPPVSFPVQPHGTSVALLFLRERRRDTMILLSKAQEILLMQYPEAKG